MGNEFYNDFRVNTGADGRKGTVVVGGKPIGATATDSETRSMLLEIRQGLLDSIRRVDKYLGDAKQ